MADFRIGTSGYSYDAWRGTFYPEAVEEREMLRFYGTAFRTVEVGYTFLRTPNARTLQGWVRDTPPGFAFSLKAPRLITHDLQLRDAGEPLTSFCDVAAALRDRVGALLFQLPPFLRKDTPRLEDFLHQMPPGYRAAFEFRHPGWFADDVFACLARFDAALCLSDHDERATPFVPTASFGYVRLRQQDYGAESLRACAERLAAVASGWETAFVYFKHEAHGRGPQLARALADLLDPAGAAASAL